LKLSNVCVSVLCVCVNTFMERLSVCVSTQQTLYSGITWNGVLQNVSEFVGECVVVCLIKHTHMHKTYTQT